MRSRNAGRSFGWLNASELLTKGARLKKFKKRQRKFNNQLKDLQHKLSKDLVVFGGIGHELNLNKE